MFSTIDLRHQGRIIAAVALAVTIFPSTPARADDVDDIVSADMQARQIPGLALAVVQNGTVLKVSGYGLSNVDKKVPVAPSTMFEIGPLTEQITAAAVLQLVGKGKIDPDGKISNYLDGCPDAWSAVTVRNLLTQTSGIKDIDEVMSPSARQAKALTVDQSLALVEKLPLDFTPGSRRHASSTNYMLLGKIVEKAGGLVYGAYISQNMLQPLGLTFTHLANPKADFPALCTGYVDGASTKAAAPMTASTYWSAGSVIASAKDLAAWDAALEAGTIVSADSVETMFEPLTVAGDTGECAFASTIRHSQDHTVDENGGATAGFSSHYLRDAGDHIDIVILTNDAAFDPMPLSHRILESYVPSIAPDPMAVKDPAVDDYCKGILRKLQDGKLDSSEFVPALWTSLQDQHLDSVGARLAELGPLNSFVQIDKNTDEYGVVYTYRCIFGDTAYILTIGPTPDGKIGDFKFGVEPFDAD